VDSATFCASRKIFFFFPPSFKLYILGAVSDGHDFAVLLLSAFLVMDKVVEDEEELEWEEWKPDQGSFAAHTVSSCTKDIFRTFGILQRSSPGTRNI